MNYYCKIYGQPNIKSHQGNLDNEAEETTSAAGNGENNSDSDEERPMQSHQKRTTNPVWDYFTKDPENGERALCQIFVGNKLCGVKCYAKKKTTSNMLRHMMTKHLDIFY